MRKKTKKQQSPPKPKKLSRKGKRKAESKKLKTEESLDESHSSSELQNKEDGNQSDNEESDPEQLESVTTQEPVHIQKLIGPSVPGTSYVPIRRQTYELPVVPYLERSSIMIPSTSDLSSDLKESTDQFSIQKHYKNIQSILINQYPGISIFRYISKTYKNNESLLMIIGIVLPKPFTTEKLEEMKVKFKFDETEIIPVHCGLCDTIFSEADIQLVKLLRHDCIKEDKNISLTLFYKCSICNRKHQKKKIIQKHLLDHILAKEMFCMACMKKVQHQKFTNYTLSQDKSVSSCKQSCKPILSKPPHFIHCQYCKTSLSTWKKLVKNITFSTNFGVNRYIYKCHICDIVIGIEKAEVDLHLQHHLESLIFLCSTCHMTNHHEAFVQKMTETKEIQKIPENIFEERSSVTNDVSEYFPDSLKSIVCGNCHQKFKQQISKKIWSSYVIISAASNQSTFKKLNYKCKLCTEEATNNWDSIEKHILEHMKDNQILCPECYYKIKRVDT